MTRDESLYPDATTFKPERFLNEDGTLTDDTVDYAFGFGRRYISPWSTFYDSFSYFQNFRVCPGRHMADSMVRFLKSWLNPLTEESSVG
jgi:cytochrome P450